MSSNDECQLDHGTVAAAGAQLKNAAEVLDHLVSSEQPKVSRDGSEHPVAWVVLGMWLESNVGLTDMSALLALAIKRLATQRSYKSIPVGMVWQDYYSPDDVLKIRGPLDAEIERLQHEHREFADRLGFGDGITEPAASLAQMVDRIVEAFTEQREHWECPRLCEQCGEHRATTRCPECHGSGCNAPACEASGAYAECEYCAGVGWVHDGCVEKSYADVAAEAEKLRGAIKSIGAILDTGLGRPMHRLLRDVLAVIERAGIDQ